MLLRQSETGLFNVDKIAANKFLFKTLENTASIITQSFSGISQSHTKKNFENLCAFFAYLCVIASEILYKNYS